MIQDILNTPQKAEIDGKTYLFEFDHFAFAAFEKNTHKSAYEMYDLLIEKNALKIDESIALLYAGMLKHHSDEEIFELTKKVEQYPGLFKNLQESLITAFVLPMMPPQVLREFQFKKKDKMTKSQAQDMTGSATM